MNLWVRGETWASDIWKALPKVRLDDVTKVTGVRREQDGTRSTINNHVLPPLTSPTLLCSLSSYFPGLPRSCPPLLKYSMMHLFQSTPKLNWAPHWTLPVPVSGMIWFLSLLSSSTDQQWENWWSIPVVIPTTVQLMCWNSPFPSFLTLLALGFSFGVMPLLLRKVTNSL